jgi:YHS domain-containing protein
MNKPKRSFEMKRYAIFALVAIFALSIASVAVAGDDCKGKEKAGHDCKHAKSDAPKVFDSAQPVGTKATCPVMGGPVVVAEDTQHSEYKGKHVYFCCAGCKPQFDADPEKYLKEKS